MTFDAALTDSIRRATGRPFVIENRRSAGGGCINTTEILEGCGERYFVKLNDAGRLDMFEAESAGLEEIAATRTVRVPRPVATGVAANRAFLVLEYLALAGHGGDSMLGRHLAAMHRAIRPTYGWWRNNTIGSTPQINREESDWVGFFREHRLRVQLNLATARGGRRLEAPGERLLESLPEFFGSDRPAASLLHGDLWGGNHGVLDDGTPVLYDPAVYFGDRETDLAMTELFGGFDSGFYAAYNEVWPLDAGYRVRKNLYNLYHILNHFNLFGGGYGRQAEQMIRGLLAEVR